MGYLRKIFIGSLSFYYALIGLEIAIMISPFAAYFYSVYAPVLNLLYSYSITRWLADFFLPHMVFTDNPFLKIFGISSPFLFYPGMAIFLVGFVQIYGAKLLRKGVVKGALYSKIRHPQYLGLGLAGLGLLLYWPRFMILVTFVTMVGLYYYLARVEENRLEKKYGEDYLEYKNSTWMFLPGRLLERWGAFLEARLGSLGRGALAMCVSLLIVGIGVGFILRGYTKGQIPRYERSGLTIISIYPMAKKEVYSILDAAFEDENISSRLRDDSLAAYLMPARYMMQSLIADVGRGSMAHHRPRMRRRIPSPLLLFYHIGHILHPHSLQGGDLRMIFVRLEGSKNRPLKGHQVLDTGVMRIPQFYVDLDSKGAIKTVMKTVPYTAWGRLPMPAF